MFVFNVSFLKFWFIKINLLVRLLTLLCIIRNQTRLWPSHRAQWDIITLILERSRWPPWNQTLICLLWLHMVPCSVMRDNLKHIATKKTKVRNLLFFDTIPSHQGEVEWYPWIYHTSWCFPSPKNGEAKQQWTATIYRGGERRRLITQQHRKKTLPKSFSSLIKKFKWEWWWGFIWNRVDLVRYLWRAYLRETWRRR